MARFAIITCMVLATIHGTSQAEDMSNDFAKCAVTKDDRQRLACYDGIRDRIMQQYKNDQTTKAKYPPIALADLKADIRGMSGKKVETVGKVQVMGGLEMVMLKTDEFDMAPVFVSAESLPRDDRKKMLNGCQMALCKARVRGTVKRSPMGDQIVAEEITWQ